eukprot:scaffold101000_cov66-Phaeocystis_antarctica.AAC.1
MRRLQAICIEISRSWRRRGRCTLHASFGDRRVQNVRSGGRTYYGWPPPSDFKIVASLVTVLLYRPNGGVHSTACVRLSFEVIHFFVIFESSWGPCESRHWGCYRRWDAESETQASRYEFLRSGVSYAANQKSSTPYSIHNQRHSNSSSLCKYIKDMDTGRGRFRNPLGFNTSDGHGGLLGTASFIVADIRKPDEDHCQLYKRRKYLHEP